MGADCVRSTPKEVVTNHYSRIDSLEQELRNRDQDLLFTMTIEHLRLTNMTDKVKEIRFALEKQFKIIYSLSEFTIQENLIKSEKMHQIDFQFPANNIQSKKVIIEIIGFQGEVIEVLHLKLIHLCTGPIHHDHLLKELRARLMFDLHLYQNISLSAKCKNLQLELFDSKSITLEGTSYKLALTSKAGSLSSDKAFQQREISMRISNHILKESNFRLQFSENEDTDKKTITYTVFIPYKKVENFQRFTLLTKKQIDFVKKSISFEEQINLNGQVIGKANFILQIQTSIVYAEQMQCLIFSEIGVSTVSPTQSYQSNEGLIKQIKQIYKSVKKFKSSLPEQKKQELIDEIYAKFQKSNEEIFTCQDQLYERQLTLLKLLNELCEFFTEGDDILNQRLWRTINYILHKPELSTRYLTLHHSEISKKAVYLRYYKFIIAVLTKIIVCTNSNITFHQLQSIQKFIAFAYFRFPWIQQIIIEALRRPRDPVITEEKLIEYGASFGSRSPSKSYVYDWQANVYRNVQSDSQLQQMLQKLESVSQNFKGWDRLLFSREDDDLFYGLYIEIWTEAEINLKNLKGKILWEYFPRYGQLLSCFLGQMNNSKISDFSTLFKRCSSKLILNEKLLNTFVIQLFPKTYLFEISCVLKCLNLLQSYFQVLTNQNKKLPHDFHFNYFYTGIKSIFEQNHSYVVVKALYILYKFYNIFNQEFKRILNNYLLSNIFNNLFLHWCTNVRQMFHHLIYYKLLQKKVSNPEDNAENFNSSRSQTKAKTTVFSEEYLLNRKINQTVRSIENYCADLNKKTQNKQKDSQKAYHEKMKEKLKQKKRKKLEQIQEFQEISQSKISEDGKMQLFMARRGSLFNQTEQLSCYKVRKMSVVDERYCPPIEQEEKQYCMISLKQYEGVKKKENSSAEVERLAKLVQGDIDS